MNYEDRKGDEKCDVYGLAFRNTASSEFWEMIGGKILEKSNTGTYRRYSRERSEKTLWVRKGERIKFYLNGFDGFFEDEPEVIEGLNHAVNFSIEFLVQQEVSISCSEQEAKLVTICF